MDHDGVPIMMDPAQNKKYFIAVPGIKKLDNQYCIPILSMHSVVFLSGLGHVYLPAGLYLKIIELNGAPLIIHLLYIHSSTCNLNNKNY